MTGAIYIITVLLIIYIICWCTSYVVESEYVGELFLEDKFFHNRILRKKHRRIIDKYKYSKKLNDYNQLYKCPHCEKYYRKYQRELYAAKLNRSYHKFVNCPHCEETISRYEQNKPNSEEFDFLKHHPSCPSLLEEKDVKEIDESIKQLAELSMIRESEIKLKEYDKN